MTIQEQLEKLRATREAHQKKLGDVAQKSMDEGRSMNTAEQEEFDDLEGQIKALDGDIDRLTRLQAVQAKSATPAAAIAQDNAEAAQAQAARVLSAVQVKNTEKVDAGIGFARVARCLAVSHIHHQNAVEIAKGMYPGDERLVTALQQKAAVPAASTGVPTWGGNLITDGGVAFADFVEWLRPRTLVGQITDRLRRLPFDTPVLVQGSGGSAKWVKEGAAKPLTQWTYSRTKLAPLKVAAIAAATKETLMRATPAADALLRDELGRAVGATIDLTFADPTVAAVADTSPGSILNGVAAVGTSAGNDADAVRQDLAALMGEFIDNNLSLTGAFFIMPERVAVQLSQMRNPLGQAEFSGLTHEGGTLLGLPVFVSGYVPTTGDGSVVALIKGDEIFLGDEDGIQVAMSDQASLVMDDAPASNSTTPTPAQVVSMFQTNSVAFLVERFINWQRRRAQAVAWLNVKWGEPPAGP